MGGGGGVGCGGVGLGVGWGGGVEVGWGLTPNGSGSKLGTQSGNVPGKWQTRTKNQWFSRILILTPFVPPSEPAQKETYGGSIVVVPSSAKES